jgi:hydrogenase-4 component B
MIWMLLATGLVVVGAGGALSLAPRTFGFGLTAQALGIGLVGLAGLALFASGEEVGASFTSELEPRLGVDPLSGYFLFVLGVVGAPAAYFASRYLAPDARGRITAALTGVFLLVLALVLCARDPLTFLAAWELMTLVPAGIILVGRHDREARSSVYAYIGLTHLMGAGTWIAVLLLADAGAFGGGDAIEAGSGTQIAIAIAALVGMGTKAGLVPLHTWLPRAHPIAPAHVSALMSGVMIKLAVYGLVRILVEWLGELPAWYGVVVLAVGGASAVIGVVYAIFQHELKRLLAFHSIENVGIIVLGLGACLLLHTRGADTAAGVALAAALLHTLNHAVFKGLLFLGAGAFEKAAGSLEIDRLGGLLQRMPWTGGAFLVGALAIAGLPPLNGFASEWLTLQSLFAVPASGGVAEGLAGALALGALAATAALAVLCFVKVVGLVLLGQPRRIRVAEAADPPFPMRAAVFVLAAACIVLGVVPGALAGPLAGLAPWSTDDEPSAELEVPWGDALPAPGIALVLLVATALLVAARGRRRAAPAPSWACGQQVGPELAWTSAGFTKPLRLVLEAALRPTRDISQSVRGGVLQEVRYEGHVPHLFETHLNRPVTRVGLWAAARARRVQSGSLTAYVAYLVALVIVVLAAVRIGVIG